MKSAIEKLANINEIKNELFLDICNALFELKGERALKSLDDYSKFIKTDRSTMCALMRKCYHMIYNIGSPNSILPFLKRVATTKKKQTKHGDRYNEGEFYGICHFRWDYKGQDLTDSELSVLKKFLNQNNIETSPISEYDKQALEFAENHNVKINILSSEHKDHFNDGVKRWVFLIKLERNNQSYTFEFGQSIDAGQKEPRMYDVLTCLTQYDPESFEDFCGNYGYDEDSRTAERTYKAVVKEWQAVERLFGDILEELQEIQ